MAARSHASLQGSPRLPPAPNTHPAQDRFGTTQLLQNIPHRYPTLTHTLAWPPPADPTTPHRFGTNQLLQTIPQPGLDTLDVDVVAAPGCNDEWVVAAFVEVEVG